MCGASNAGWRVAASPPWPELSNSITSATWLKNRRITAHRRVVVMPAVQSCSRLATSGVFGAHHAGVRGSLRCIRCWSSAARAKGGSATLPALLPLPTRCSQ